MKNQVSIVCCGGKQNNTSEDALIGIVLLSTSGLHCSYWMAAFGWNVHFNHAHYQHLFNSISRI